MQQRQRKQPWLDTFDGADPNASTAKRSPGETSLQALAMLNSALLDEQADALGARVTAAYPDDEERIAHAYRLVFGRAPGADEIRDCVKFLADAHRQVESRAAMAGLMHVLLASDEFLFVD